MSKSEQTIKKFFDQASRRDFARDFLFRVTSISLRNGAFSMGVDDLVYAKTAKLPTRQIENIATPYMGLDFNLPGRAKYGDSSAYTIEFYCDAEASLHKRLLSETREVFNDANSTGDYKIADENSTIVLHQLDKNLVAFREYKLIGASIRDCGALEGKISDGTGAVVSFSAQFAYHYFITSVPGNTQEE